MKKMFYISVITTLICFNSFNYGMENPKVNQTNNYDSTSLHLAISNGDIDAIESLIKKGADIDQTNSDGCTPLSLASYLNNSDVIPLLLEKGPFNEGALVNKADKYGWTPLYWATRHNNTAIVNSLCLYGARVDLTDVKYGNTPLHNAIRDGHLDTAKILIRWIPNINQTNKEGDTPLHKAIIYCPNAIEFLLVRKDIHIDQADKYGQTALHKAAAHGRTNAAELLINAGANVNQAIFHSSTPLHLAARHGYTEIVQLLLDAGANINQATFDGITPLHSAALSGHTNVIELLLNNGADVKQTDCHGRTPLLAAIHNIDRLTNPNITNAIQLLINNETINQADKYGDTPLLCATRRVTSFNDKNHCLINIVEFLIKKGANVNQVNHFFGGSPLHIAAANNHFNVIKLLINAKANVKQTDNKGQTPLYIAIEKDNAEIAQLLYSSYKPKINTTENMYITRKPQGVPSLGMHDHPLCIAAALGAVKTVESFINSGENIEQCNKYRCAPLHFASEKGHVKVVNILCQAGANLRNEACEGTPLHIAVKNNHAHVVELLLAKGADANQADIDGYTPLDLAVNSNEIITLLKQGRTK